MRFLQLLVLSLVTVYPVLVHAGNDCPFRGELDARYCDANRDLVADPPTDPKDFQNPGALVLTNAPVEDPAHYEKVFRPFTDFLTQCTGRQVVFWQATSNGAEIEAMLTGRLHVAMFSTGPTTFAVSIAGAVPFAMRGDADGAHGYHLLLIVRSDSPFRKVTDLKGRKVAHTSPTSNSGNMAPTVLLPREGLVPGTDYQPMFSGRHDRSVLGVAQGEYDAAAVASDVFYRMVERGTVGKDDFRILYKSGRFPVEAFSYVYNLDPAIRDRLTKCFFEFRYPESMRREFDGADRFVPVNYQRDWALVREVAAAAREKSVTPVREKKVAKPTR